MLSRCTSCDDMFIWEPIDLWEPAPPLCVRCETAETFNWLGNRRISEENKSKVNSLIAYEKRVAEVGNVPNREFPQ